MMTAKPKQKPRNRVPNPGGKRGGPQHQPTQASLATVRAMAGVGYSQSVIAQRIGISEPTLRAHYREALDHSIQDVCSRVFANLVRTASTKNDAAGVLAAKFILSCRAGWKERSAIEIEETGAGIIAIKKMVEQAEASAAAMAREAAEDEAEAASQFLN
jgi:hypothetical protein